MKAKIKIDFMKISGLVVDKKMATPRFVKLTKQTLEKLCKTIERYFNDYKIETKATFEIEEDGEDD